MTAPKLRLLLLEDRLAVCRLGPTEDVPSWAAGVGFSSATRTRDELSVVCPEGAVPAGVRAEKGWRALRVAGSMDFALVGVLASMAVPLAGAGVGIFAISTFDTDYLLVKADDLDRAIGALAASGHVVSGPDRAE